MHCLTQPFLIGQLYVSKNSIDENPIYQRESNVWSPQKKQLFIDSIINDYDIPKIYFNDLRKVNHNKGLKKYAIIDGKQRLSAIYEFIDNGFALAKDFEVNKDSEFESLKPFIFFKDFSEADKKRLENIALTIVLVQNATEDDIEELFFRLNNGEPLNGAEKRNNIPGDMNALIREVATNTFFTKKLKFKNKRYSHYEISAKFILLEKNHMGGGDIFSDLKKKFLDTMVEDNKKLTQAFKTGLTKRVDKNLSLLNKVFTDDDPLLNKQAYPPLYYVFIKMIHSEYGHEKLNTYLRKFIVQFQIKRQQNLGCDENTKDPSLSEFSRLMQQGTNDLSSLISRTSILRKFFLLEFPDVELLDKQRNFSDEERFAIYISGGKQCAECERELSDIKEMEADHKRQWKFGGPTSLKNGRSLCQDCNIKLKENVK